MLKSEAYVGQIVRMDVRERSCLAKVIKINQKNIKVVTADGTRWNAHPIFLIPALPYEVEQFESESSTSPELVLGSLVRFKSGREGNYVVVGNHGGLWRVAALGGDGGRYLRGISADQLEIIDFNVES